MAPFSGVLSDHLEGGREGAARGRRAWKARTQTELSRAQRLFNRALITAAFLARAEGEG